MVRRGPAKGEQVAVGVFQDYDSRLVLFAEEWRADKTVTVRKYRRTVRADGVIEYLTVVVVRRKV